MHHIKANMASFSFPETFIACTVALAFVIIIAVLAVIVLRPLVNHAAQKDVPILSGRVTLIYKEEHCTRIVEDGEIYQLAKGETQKPLDLHDRGYPLNPHPCYTSDNARIKVTAYAVWSISNVRDLLRSASSSEESLCATVQMAILPALSETIAGYKLAEVNGKRGEIARTTQNAADAWLKRYGLTLHKVSITYIHFPDPPQPAKPDGHKEAERLSTLDGVVPKVDEKTLRYARQLRELELASAKEARTEKKS
jgi:uncharacterized membrane protein YqiK